MEISLHRVVSVLAVTTMLLVLPVHGQINTACTASMLASFTPCINFVTNSTANTGGSPTRDCCTALKNMTSNSMDCMCLIVTGNVPFQIPINRTLAISLPRACKMTGVPVQCKASGAPIPAPGPAALGPTASGISPSASPEGSVVPDPTPSANSPESDTTLSPDGTGSVPTENTGSRPALTPSAAIPSYSISPSLLLFALACLVFKY